MRCFAHQSQELAIGFIPLSILSGSLPFLEDGFGIVQNQETALLAQITEKLRKALIEALLQEGRP